MTQAERERAIGPVQLLALGVNGIVGVGIFFAPATVALDAPGLGTVFVFLATGLALLPAALTFARLGSRFDEDGGPIVFARAAFGEPAAFVVGWVAYVSAVFSTGAVLVALTRAVLPALGVADELGLRLAPALLVTACAVVAAAGLRVSAHVWTSLTVLKLLPLVLLLLALALSWQRFPAPAPAAPGAGWLRAALTVVFACQGFEIVPVIAGQVRTPVRSVPFATVGSLLAAIALYTALVLACVLVLPGLASSTAPLAEAAGVLAGAGLQRLVAAGTSFSALGIAFGMMVTTPHYLSALSQGERSLFGVERLSRRGVPLRALVVTWLAVAAAVSLGELGELFALSSIAVLMQFGTSALALMALAWRRERNLVPAESWPALPTLAVGLVLVATGATAREALVAGTAVLVGYGLLRLSRPRTRTTE